MWMAFQKIDDLEDELRLELGSIAFGSLLETSNVVYLESPIYWKLFTPLQELRRFATSRHRARGTALTGVPDYFYDLAESLTYEYTEEMAYPEIHRWLVDDIIGGKVSVSELGEMSFEEAGRSYPLSTVATGVANIGVLAMLIERKVIDRGTMLFIDEPEAHLHTAWQAVMADALFRLATEGVNVVKSDSQRGHPQVVGGAPEGASGRRAVRRSQPFPRSSLRRRRFGGSTRADQTRLDEALFRSLFARHVR